MTVCRLFTPPAAAGAEFQPPKSCKIFLIGGGDEFDWGKNGFNGEKVSAKIPENKGGDEAMGRPPVSADFPVL